MDEGIWEVLAFYVSDHVGLGVVGKCLTNTATRPLFRDDNELFQILGGLDVAMA